MTLEQVIIQSKCYGSNQFQFHRPNRIKYHQYPAQAHTKLQCLVLKKLKRDGLLFDLWVLALRYYQLQLWEGSVALIGWCHCLLSQHCRDLCYCPFSIPLPPPATHVHLTADNAIIAKKFRVDQTFSILLRQFIHLRTCA